MLEQPAPEELHPMGEKGAMQEQFVESCLPWQGPRTGRGEGLLSLTRKQWQKQCAELTITHIPHLPALLAGRR